MKILHTVESYYPSVGGMQEVVKQISERLVRLGYQVTVATRSNSNRVDKVFNGVSIEEFNISGNHVLGYKGTDAEIKRYQDYLTNSDFDVVTNFAAQQWATDLALPILDKIKAKKVFVPTGFSALYIPRYKKYFGCMKIWMKKYDMNVFLSDDYRDVNFAKKYGINKRVLIPNGAASEEFEKKYDYNFREEFGIPASDFLIITVGSHTGSKGHRELIEIFRKAKIENATLAIIGNSFGGGCTKYCKFAEWLSNKKLFGYKKIIVPDLTRLQTVVAYQQADLFLFPSNIECSPIVLFESMASKTPFLTSDVGNSKEIVKWSKAGLVMKTSKSENGNSNVDIKDGVLSVKKLYKDVELRNILSKNGYESWKKKFSWEVISKKYESLYISIIKQ